MHPPLTRFDRHGRLRLGSPGYPTASAWHPLYAEDEFYHYVAVCFSNGGGIKLYEVRNAGKGIGTCLALVQHFQMDNNLICMSWSPNGRFLAVGEKGGNNRIRLFNVTNNQEMPFDGIGHTGAVTSVDFSPDGRLLVSGSLDATVKLWVVETGIPVSAFREARHEKGVTAVRFNPNDETIVSAGMDNCLRLWAVASGEPVPGFSGGGHENSITAVSFSPDGTDIVSGGRDDRLRMWNAVTGQETKGVFNQGHDAPITSICFSPGRRHFILSAAEDNSLRLWERETGRRIPSFYGRGHLDSITSAQISPDGSLIISTSEDGVVILRDCPVGTLLDSVSVSGHEQDVTSLCFAPDGNGLYSVSWDRTLKRWDSNGDALARFDGKGHTGDINAACCSPDGRNIITAGEEMILRLWNATTGSRLPFPDPDQKHEAWIHCLAWSSDGRWVVSGDEQGVLLQTVLHNAPDSWSFQWKLGESTIKTVACSPNAKRILAGGKGLLRLLDAGSEDHFLDFDNEFRQMVVNVVCFCPEGRWMLLGCNEGLQVRELPSGKKSEVFFPQSGQGAVGAAAYSPTGKYIAFAGNDNTVCLLDASSGEKVSGFTGIGHLDSISRLAFSPDGAFLATASHDRTLIVWSLEKILGPEWFREHLATPLIITAVRFPEDALNFMEETGQGVIVRNAPLARCGGCGKVFPVEQEWLGTDIRCPMDSRGLKCGRLLRLNGFVAGTG